MRPLELLDADGTDLLALCRDGWKLGAMITRARNQFTQLTAVAFPELKTFFTGSVSTVSPVTLITAYPTPALLAEAPEEEVAQALWQARCCQHARRVGELQGLARASSGLLPNPGRAWRLKWLTDFLLTNFQHQKALYGQAEDLVEQRDDYQLIVNVPSAGPATLRVILALTGDVDRFSDYRKYVAYSDYFPGLEKSQTIDRTKMSRRRNRDLKRALFHIAAPLVWFDEGSNAYKGLLQRKMAEGRKWYQAMPFVCAALARHIYHCLKFNDPCHVEKVFEGSSFNPTSAEESLSVAVNLDDTFDVMETSLDETVG